MNLYIDCFNFVETLQDWFIFKEYTSKNMEMLQFIRGKHFKAILRENFLNEFFINMVVKYN